jgi:hypothetical protein
MADSADVNMPGDVRGLSFSFESGMMGEWWHRNVPKERPQ